jgi:hypothetical protein
MTTLTIILAIYGAVLSSIALGWHVYRDMTERGRLRVYCYVGDIHTPALGKKEGPVLTWSISNVGRQAVWLQTIGGDLDGDNHFMINPHQQLPRELKPGESFLDYADVGEVDPERLTALWACDSLGRYHKARQGDVDAIRPALRPHG